MASFSFKALSFCFLFLCSSFLVAAQQGGRQQQGQGRGQGQQGRRQEACSNVEQNLNPLEPNNRFQYEAGVTEMWDENHPQLRCAGVAASRHVIQSRGLLLPSFNNAPMLVYVIQGYGVLGTMNPGCPETYQSFQQPQEEREERGQRFRDQHQKIHQLRRGDVVALPEGIAHWCYNEGNEELVLVVIHHTNNQNNQLDQNIRRFFLAGNPQQQQQQTMYQRQQQGQWQRERQSGNNIFQAFDTEILAEAFGVSRETARNLQNENDVRGNIVRVQKELRLLRPQREQQQQEQREYGRYQTTTNTTNGVEETICTLRIRENLANPERADVYTARGGSISALNSLNLPILRHLGLSAGRGNLQPYAMLTLVSCNTPHWNLNSHSISYISRGSARVQIVGSSRRAAFDGEVREGQLLIVPQNFAHFKQAGNQGLEWFTLKTNDVAKASPLAGKTSVIRAMPIDVLVNAYLLSREEAKRVKYSREEVTILSPRDGAQSQRRGSDPYSIVA